MNKQHYPTQDHWKRAIIAANPLVIFRRESYRAYVSDEWVAYSPDKTLVYGVYNIYTRKGYVDVKLAQTWGTKGFYLE